MSSTRRLIDTGESWRIWGTKESFRYARSLGFYLEQSPEGPAWTTAFAHRCADGHLSQDVSNEALEIRCKRCGVFIQFGVG